MGSHGAKENGLEEAPTTIKESVGGMVGKVCFVFFGSICF